MDIQIADELITYQVIESGRKTISMEVTQAGEVLVRVPYGTDARYIRKIVASRQRWLYTKVKAAKEQQHTMRSYETGRKLLYIGQEVELIVEYTDSREGVYLKEDKLHVVITRQHKEYIPKMLEYWYRQQARRILSRMTEQYAHAMNLTVNRISIKDQKTRWGSCSSKHNLNFNYRLVMAPQPVIEYVVIHELCHLLHMNHSKEFWNEVEKIQFGYKDNRQWLKDHQNELRI